MRRFRRRPLPLSGSPPKRCAFHPPVEQTAFRSHPMRIRASGRRQLVHCLRDKRIYMSGARFRDRQGNKFQQQTDIRLSADTPRTRGRNRTPLQPVCMERRTAWVCHRLFSTLRPPPAMLLCRRRSPTSHQPGGLDMAGIVVAARKEDYEKITEEDLLKIYQEVSL